MHFTARPLQLTSTHISGSASGAVINQKMVCLGACNHMLLWILLAASVLIMDERKAVCLIWAFYLNIVNHTEIFLNSDWNLMQWKPVKPVPLSSPWPKLAQWRESCALRKGLVFYPQVRWDFVNTLPSFLVSGWEQIHGIHIFLSNLHLLGLSHCCEGQLNREEYVEVILF